MTKLDKEIDKLGLRHFLAGWFFLALSVIFLSGCLFRRNRGDSAPLVNPGDQPDKILFEKAVKEVDRSRFEVGRLTLQTLINTYPDSEYLAKAKLAIADSYYKEGGVSGLTQAEAEYKDFITFFPTAPEAPEAQFRVGMAHYRLMSKPDRDRTEAKLAEVELKEFLLKYPDSRLMPRVKARLRQVQEVLGQGEFKVANFYFAKGANRAAQSRFQEIVDRYPNFSQGDSALWYLGETLERLKKPQEAVPYYARIITEHPLSPRVGDAKDRLIAMKQPIPRPTRAVLARAQADAVRRSRRDLFQKLGGMLSSSPDTSATRHGPVRLGGQKPAEVEVAKTPVPETAGNTIVAQPVSDASLNSGKPVEPKSAGDGAPGESAGNPQENSTAPQVEANSNPTKADHPTDTSPPAKTKAKRGFFRKLIKPF